MAFDQEINNFVIYGTFNYQFDEAGNVIMNPSSSVFEQHYLSLGLSTLSYDATKIQSFHNPTFTEFVPTIDTNTTSSIPQEVLDELNLITQQNQDLQGQLDQLVSRSEVDSSFADELAIKDIIITLRMQLGQGESEADFEDTFPFLPIPLEQRDSAPTT